MDGRFKEIFDGMYRIYGDGSLYSIRNGKFLRPSTDKCGYAYYVISINGKRKTLKAHRLVAEAFVQRENENQYTVNHKNGIRSDNRVENLEWATPKEQIHDAMKRSAIWEAWRRTNYREKGAKINFGRKQVDVFSDDGELIGRYDSLKKAAEANGMNYSKASECANGKRKRVGGLKCKFV